METVQSLRAQGHKVYVTHLRRWVQPSILATVGEVADNNVAEQDYILQAKGGMTRVKVIKNDHEIVAYAHCSKKDVYNKKLGVKIALGRALKVMEKDNDIDTITH